MENNDIDVSVVVPVYNMEKRLKNCLDSLLAQTLQKIEFILVNDGSTDNSGAICQEYADKFPDKIRFITQENGGVSAAYNQGLSAVRGRWTGFCDSDDVCEPDLYACLLRQAEENQADMSCCALICDGSKHEDIRMVVPVSEEVVWNRDQIVRKCILPLLRLNPEDVDSVKGYLVVTLLRTDIIKKHQIRFIEKLQIAEDESFMLEYLGHVQKIAFSNRVLYHYIVFENSLTTQIFKTKKVDLLLRERYWYMLAKNRLQCYEKIADLNRTFPEIRNKLRFLFYYHKALWIQLSCKNKKECKQIMADICKEIRQIRMINCRSLPRKLRLFRLIALCGPYGLRAGLNLLIFWLKTK